MDRNIDPFSLERTIISPEMFKSISPSLSCRRMRQDTRDVDNAKRMSHVYAVSNVFCLLVKLRKMIQRRRQRRKSERKCSRDNGTIAVSPLSFSLIIGSLAEGRRRRRASRAGRNGPMNGGLPGTRLSSFYILSRCFDGQESVTNEESISWLAIPKAVSRIAPL